MNENKSVWEELCARLLYNHRAIKVQNAKKKKKKSKNPDLFDLHNITVLPVLFEIAVGAQTPQHYLIFSTLESASKVPASGGLMLRWRHG